MKRGYPPLWFGALLLLLALFWKMLDAPLTAEQFSALRTPLWQARILAPARIERILTLWLPAPAAEENSGLLTEDGMDPETRRLTRLNVQEPKSLNVYLPSEGQLVSMPLESYVCGVVAAEMPAAYHLEALKAQAVAARTRGAHQMENGGCASHPGADICGDSACCQGYASTEDCKKKWGAEYALYRDRVLTAVKETEDELLLYEGEPITVLYHAMSGGWTESAQAVFSQSVPYLVSVESKGEENAKGFYADAQFSFEEAATLLNQAFPHLKTTGEELRRTLAIGTYTSTGRVQTVLAGKEELDAKKVRKALGLRSTWFSLTADQDVVTFHQRGYGHGVGMSQVGANSMAANGADCESILAHYYPGVTLGKR